MDRQTARVRKVGRLSQEPLTPLGWQHEVRRGATVVHARRRAAGWAHDQRFLATFRPNDPDFEAVMIATFGQHCSG